MLLLEMVVFLYEMVASQLYDKCSAQLLEVGAV